MEESFGDNRNVSDHFCLFLCLFLYSSVTAINNIVGVKRSCMKIGSLDAW